VFVIIALAVLISISVLIGGLRNSPTPLVVFKEVMDAMIAALCCVVPFLREYVTNVTTPFISRVNI